MEWSTSDEVRPNVTDGGESGVNEQNSKENATGGERGEMEKVDVDIEQMPWQCAMPLARRVTEPVRTGE
jgi:hypothetical protein